MCLKLQCCPNLFGPVLVTDKCPENCSLQTKTKYSESGAPFLLSNAAATKGVNLFSDSLLLREEAEVVQAGGGRRDGGRRRSQAGAPQEEEEGHICAEEKAFHGSGLHPRRLPAG